MKVLILSRAEIERLLDPRELIGALGDAFRALSAGEVKARRATSCPVRARRSCSACPAARARA